MAVVIVYSAALISNEVVYWWKYNLEDLGKVYNLCFVFVDAEAADAAVRQQLSSLLFVRRMCEAKIQTLKYGDGEIPAFPSVSN